MLEKWNIPVLSEGCILQGHPEQAQHAGLIPSLLQITGKFLAKLNNAAKPPQKLFKPACFIVQLRWAENPTGGCQGAASEW